MKLFCKTKNKNEIKNNDNNIYHLFLTSFISISFCIVCLCGTTYAWFTSTVSTNINTVKSATYSVTVTIADDKEEIIATLTNNSSIEYTFTSSGTYKVTITPNQNGIEGYCKITIEDNDYYTGKLLSDSDSLTLIVKANKDEILTITPSWIAYPEAVNITNNDEIGTNSISPTSLDDDSSSSIPNNDEIEDSKEIETNNQDFSTNSSLNETDNKIKDVENIDENNSDVANNETTENSSSNDGDNTSSDLKDTSIPNDDTSSDNDLSSGLNASDNNQSKDNLDSNSNE